MAEHNKELKSLRVRLDFYGLYFFVPFLCAILITYVFTAYDADSFHKNKMTFFYRDFVESYLQDYVYYVAKDNDDLRKFFSNLGHPLIANLLIEAVQDRYNKLKNIKLSEKEKEKEYKEIKDEFYYNIFCYSYRRYFVFFALLILIIVLFIKKKKPYKYTSCPHCSKSVLVLEKWQCDKCNHYQRKPRYLSSKCDECGARLETVFCEHCHKELRV